MPILGVSTVHEDFVALATELISENGRTLQLLTDAKSGDRFEPTIVTTSEDVIGVNTQFNRTERVSDMYVEGDLIFLIDAQVIPDAAQRLRDGTIEYSIVDIIEIKPGETTILYKIHARI